MGKTWLRSEEQEVFLREKVFDYPEARLRGRQEKFFADLFESWFKQWSESETQFPDADPDNLTEAQVVHLRESVVARKQQLRNYIYWRTDHDRRLKRTTRKEVPSLEELLNGKRAKQGPRKKKLIDVYSRLYYEVKMAPEVERRVEATRPPGELKKGKAYHSRRMKIVQQVKKEMWEGESPEVRRQVEEEREKLGVGKSAEIEVEGGARNDQLELKRQQREISMLGETLDQVAKELHSRTGYVMSVLLGGLRPDGTVHAVRLHCGETAEGHDFEESTVDYDDCVVKPWYSFVEQVFPPSKRRAQAEFYKRTFKVKEGVIEANVSAPIATEKWSGKDNGSDDEDDGGSDGAKGDDGIIPDIDVDKQPMATSPTTSSTMYDAYTPTASSQSEELYPLNPQSLPAGMETLESAHPLTASPGSDRNTEAATGASQSTFLETGISNPVAFPGITNPSGLFWTFPDADADADSLTKTSFGPMTEELHSALGDNSLLYSADYMSLLFQNSMPSGGLTMASGLDSTSNAWSFTGKAPSSTTWSNLIAPPAILSDTPATAPPSSSPLDLQTPKSVNCSPSLTQLPSVPSFNAPVTVLDSPTLVGSTNTSNSMAAVSPPNTSHATTSDDALCGLAPPMVEQANAGPPSPNASHATTNTESLSLPVQPVDESTNAGPPSQQLTSDVSPKQSKRGTSKKGKENPSRTAPKKAASSVAPLQDMGNTNQARPQRDRKRKLHPDEQFVQEQEEREKKQRRGRGQKH